LRRKCWAVME